MKRETWWERPSPRGAVYLTGSCGRAPDDFFSLGGEKRSSVSMRQLCDHACQPSVYGARLVARLRRGWLWN